MPSCRTDLPSYRGRSLGWRGELRPGSRSGYESRDELLAALAIVIMCSIPSMFVVVAASRDLKERQKVIVSRC